MISSMTLLIEYFCRHPSLVLSSINQINPVEAVLDRSVEQKHIRRTNCSDTTRPNHDKVNALNLTLSSGNLISLRSLGAKQGVLGDKPDM